MIDFFILSPLWNDVWLPSQANENGHGALCCNRAIMIVAEKMPNMYDDIFSTFNDQEDSMRVRVYTYHVSEEQGDESYEMKFVSCMNLGNK